jgi:hypothetical protein
MSTRSKGGSPSAISGGDKAPGAENARKPCSEHASSQSMRALSAITITSQQTRASLELLVNKIWKRSSRFAASTTTRKVPFYGLSFELGLEQASPPLLWKSLHDREERQEKEKEERWMIHVKQA